MDSFNQIILRGFLFYCFIQPLFSIAQNEPKATPDWRPQYHFTPLKNWTNDPNGLIYIRGQYYLYNQQNPFENKWGHMSWGHAQSSDLVHWKHFPIAIPEIITKNKDTTWIFSGSAVWDSANTSGFCQAGGCLISIYTADQPNLKRESQFIAYSLDNGRSFTNYENNPVIDLHLRNFRDPNVSWNQQLKQWLMVVALPETHKVRFYSSKNLKQWDLLSEFGPQGFISAEWECPFFLQLPVDGKPGLKKWLLAVSAGGPEKGPYMQYFIGDFDGKNFHNDNPADRVLTLDYGDCLYAAIPWNNLPENRKTFIGWLEPGAGQTYPWKGQMSIPRDMLLKQYSDGIRLLQRPASLIKKNLATLSNRRIFEMKDKEIPAGEQVIHPPQITSSNCYWLMAELDLEPATIAGFKIAQKKGLGNKLPSEITIGYDPTKHQLYVDRRKIVNGEINQDRMVQTIDLSKSDPRIILEILVDHSSLEIFVNGGEEVLSAYIYPEKEATGISVFSVGGKTRIRSLKIWDLSMVHPNE